LTQIEKNENLYAGQCSILHITVQITALKLCNLIEEDSCGGMKPHAQAQTYEQNGSSANARTRKLPPRS